MSDTRRLFGRFRHPSKRQINHAFHCPDTHSLDFNPANNKSEKVRGILVRGIGFKVQERQRTGALQDASRHTGATVVRASIMDSGGPPPLSVRGLALRDRFPVRLGTPPDIGCRGPCASGFAFTRTAGSGLTRPTKTTKTDFHPKPANQHRGGRGCIMD